MGERMKFMLLVLASLMVTDVQAYLDPGTGSMLLQVILGGIAAVAVAVKLYWFRILALLGLRKPTESEEESGKPS
jgi:hypothetical protein